MNDSTYQTTQTEIFKTKLHRQQLHIIFIIII